MRRGSFLWRKRRFLRVDLKREGASIVRNGLELVSGRGLRF